LQNESHSGLRYGRTLYAMFYPFLGKDAAEKEAAKKEETKKKAAEKEAAKKETVENPMARVICIMSYFYF
jgi:hypothetical protein